MTWCERRKGDGKDSRRQWQGGEEQRWPMEEEAAEGEGNDDMRWVAMGRQMLEERKAAVKAGWKRLDSGRGRATATAGKEEQRGSEQLNHEARRTTIRAPTPKKLTREELWEHSTKGLCWHCNEPWSREHRYKKGRLLMIEPVEDEDIEPSKESLEIEKEVKEEQPKSIDFMVHALAAYSNPQTIKV
ncbi:hypothetical protein B296_00032107 [Ensete ventricosum]|uniref:Uncharacterized protein n=1 Tax=Ensete ventricosum TaxID=4639 RepID=A0A426YVD3_ENSVE|nr:hypothetical protein B296_00032107 [Ensete ventricosum]